MATLADLPATFTTSQACDARVQYRDLYAARDSGDVVELSRGAFGLDVQLVEAAPGEPVRVHSPARTVVDLLRLRSRIGEPVAFVALRPTRPTARTWTCRTSPAGKGGPTTDADLLARDLTLDPDRFLANVTAPGGARVLRTVRAHGAARVGVDDR